MVAEKLPDDFDPGFDELQKQWEDARSELLRQWPGMSESAVRSIVDQVRNLVLSGDRLGLNGVSVPYLDMAAQIEAAMLALADLAAEHAVGEADRQEIVLNKGLVDRHYLASLSQVLAGTLTSGLIMSGIREALRLWGNNMVSGVAEGVDKHLGTLTDAQPAYILGGGFTGAQREGRMSTALGGPGAALYSSEILDRNTCKYCRAIDGMWLGNLEDPLKPWEATYPAGGYVDCLGRDRCRGQIVYVWRGGSDWKKWVEKDPIDPSNPPPLPPI